MTEILEQPLTTARVDELVDALAHPTQDDAAAMDAWWRANNYLTVGQIYLKDNALLRRELLADDIKPRLLGHWGTSPGLSFIYTHASRLIRLTEQSMIYITGPGHGGPASSRPPTSRTPTPRSTRASPRTPTACCACSASSPRPAVSPPTSP